MIAVTGYLEGPQARMAFQQLEQDPTVTLIVFENAKDALAWWAAPPSRGARTVVWGTPAYWWASMPEASGEDITAYKLAHDIAPLITEMTVVFQAPPGVDRAVIAAHSVRNSLDPVVYRKEKKLYISQGEPIDTKFDALHWFYSEATWTP